MKFLYYSALVAVLFSCKSGDEEADAYGNFQATEILISAESAGKILSKMVVEGEEVNRGQAAYLIDTVQTHLKKQELLARRIAVVSKKSNLLAQIAVLKEQTTALDRDIARLSRMLESGAVPQKQVDDLKTQKSIISKQVAQVNTNFSAIDAEVHAIDAGIRQVEDLLLRSKVQVPRAGVVLETYAEEGEAVAPGKPLFKMADMDTLEMKAYFSSNQLASVRIEDRVEVLIDNGKGGLKSIDGKISWIAANAEFTPKVIQTREERVNLVYAVRIRVPNDGTLRINMPGEVKLIR